MVLLVFVKWCGMCFSVISFLFFGVLLSIYRTASAPTLRVNSHDLALIPLHRKAPCILSPLTHPSQLVDISLSWSIRTAVRPCRSVLVSLISLLHLWKFFSLCSHLIKLHRHLAIFSVLHIKTPLFFVLIPQFSILTTLKTMHETSLYQKPI